MECIYFGASLNISPSAHVPILLLVDFGTQVSIYQYYILPGNPLQRHGHTTQPPIMDRTIYFQTMDVGFAPNLVASEYTRS